jgi:hypothetical protein
MQILKGEKNYFNTSTSFSKLSLIKNISEKKGVWLQPVQGF